MLDIKYIREESDEVARRLATRGRGDEAHIRELTALDEERRGILKTVENLKAERNKASKEVGALKSKGLPADEILVRMKQVSDEIAQLDKSFAELEVKQQDLLLRIPNVPHVSVPVGVDADANRIEKTWGTPVQHAFEPKTHWEIGEARGLLDLARATKISGSGFIVYTGKGARLERGLINFLLDLHTQNHGYTEVGVPFVVRGESMVGTGQLPKFSEDMYAVKEEDLYLIPTAEVPVTNLHRDEIVSEAQLPISYAAYTPCFRREAGSAGKDTRGMIRVHQFDKVELVHIVKPEESYATLEKLLGHAETVLQKLGLTYRVLALSTGDMGFGAAKCYDIEVWAPGLKTWLEVSSCSNFESFQARRLQLRYKDSEGKNQFCHTLNGSGTALARLYIALLETYQQPDGSVLLPEILQPYLGLTCL
ncbi:MAG: serine--tRNA ligase [Verrucomicrobiota bacterium]